MADPEAVESFPLIFRQFVKGRWDWVVMIGGANDLAEDCGCRNCDATLDAMISRDGRSGDIPKFVRRRIAQGIRVLLIGYYPPSSQPNEFTACKSAMAELNRRLARLARSESDVHFVSAARVISPKNRRAYDKDRVHPSLRGSQLIGQLAARRIRSAMR